MRLSLLAPIVLLAAGCAAAPCPGRPVARVQFLSSLFRGRHMVEAWNALGLDVATFGNHEFDLGPATLLDRMKESRFP